MTTATLALVIVGAILLQMILALMIAGWRRHRDNPGNNSDEMNLEQMQAPAAAQAEAEQINPRQWEGFKPFRVVRRVVENVTGDVCSFYLAPSESMVLSDFLPGQYLTMKFDLQSEGETIRGKVTRCYSLSDRPRPDYYRISVKRVGAPLDQPGTPPGVASNYLHDHVEVGDLLMVKAPSGNFHLIDEPDLPLVLIAGGIGITPMLSIINTLLGQSSRREIWLFYGVRNGRDVIMHAQLMKLARTHSQFYLHLCYSRPDGKDRIGIDYQHEGYVDVALLQDVLKLRRYQYYICGPAAMMASMVSGLRALGLPSSDIYYEAFGPATVPQPKKAASEASLNADQAWQVTFSKSNRSAQWTNGYDSLLSFIEAQGVEVESVCRSGSCGSCQTQIESGEVEYNQAPDVDVEAGHCLLCVARPRNNLKLAI